MLQNIDSKTLKNLIFCAFFAGFSQIGYAQSIDVQNIEVIEVEVPRSGGEVTIPGSDEGGGGSTAADDLGDCALPRDCGSASDSGRKELSPKEEADAISNGWSS